MSRLSLHGRPYVTFDPKDRNHRQWYAEFVHTGTWGKCPVRFVVPDDHGNLITMIQRSLISYYVEQEFTRSRPRGGSGARRKKPSKLKKVVDNLAMLRKNNTTES